MTCTYFFKFQFYEFVMKLLQVFYDQRVIKQVDVPSFSGSFGILPKHVPTLAVLKPGVVTVYEEDGSAKKIFVSSGTVTINENNSVQVYKETINQFFMLVFCKILQNKEKNIDRFQRKKLILQKILMDLQLKKLLVKLSNNFHLRQQTKIKPKQQLQLKLQKLQYKLYHKHCASIVYILKYHYVYH